MGAMGTATATARAKTIDAPTDLTRGRLTRLGEGIGKVVYASEHWVVKRERRPSEVVSLIVVWKAMHKLDRILPGRLARRVLNRPTRILRFIRASVHAVMLLVPSGLWWTRQVSEAFQKYVHRDVTGERLARLHLEGTPFVPRRVSFAPIRVRVPGWPGFLIVSEATERIEMTLQERINDLARARRFDEVETWLNRFLDLRQEGWKRGVFSLDAHLNNFGVTQDRIVLLDAGGLTDNWSEIAERLEFEDRVTSPHIQLGLEMTLRDHPAIAQRFDMRWRATVNRDVVRAHWPLSA